MNDNSRRFSRRSFLKYAGVAAAPLVVPGTSLGNSTRRAPSSRISLAIIGLKKMGGAHVRNWLGFGDVQIVAICDVDRDLRLKTKQRVEQS